MLWFLFFLGVCFFCFVNGDSGEYGEDDEYEVKVPCVPIGYKCFSSDDCCVGATCVATKWSSHLVCLVAGYKEDLKLARIGRKKVEQQDLEYLKNMYGFTVDYSNFGLMKDFETILDPFYSTTVPSVSSSPVERISEQNFDSVTPETVSNSAKEPLYEHFLTTVPSVSISPVNRISVSDENLKVSSLENTDSLNVQLSTIQNSEESTTNIASTNFNVPEIDLTTSQIDSNSIVMENNESVFDLSNNTSSTENQSSSNNASQINVSNQFNISFSTSWPPSEKSQTVLYNRFDDALKDFRNDNESAIQVGLTRMKRFLEVEAITEDTLVNLGSNTDSDYTDSYIDPFSYIDNTDQATLIGNITSQIKHNDESFSYSSLETLFQNLSAIEFTLPIGYNQTQTTTTPTVPVTIPERLWNLANNISSTNDYPDLDFGEMYNLLNGNHSDKWLFDEYKEEGIMDSISFNLTSVNKFLNSFSFFKGKNESAWDKIFSFVHREKKNSTGNVTFVSVKEEKNKTKHMWEMLTGFFHNNDETIKFDFIPRNLTNSSNTSLVGLISDFKSCGLTANISCLLLSILNPNGTIDRNSNRKAELEKAKQQLLEESLGKPRFVKVVKLISKQEENAESTTGVWQWVKLVSSLKTSKEPEDGKEDSGMNESYDNGKWWFASEENISESFFGISSTTPKVDADFVEKNVTSGSKFWRKVKDFVLFKKTPEVKTTTVPTATTTAEYDFRKRYLQWSADRKKSLKVETTTDYGIEYGLSKQLGELQSDHVTGRDEYEDVY